MVSKNTHMHIKSQLLSNNILKDSKWAMIKSKIKRDHPTKRIYIQYIWSYFWFPQMIHFLDFFVTNEGTHFRVS